MAILLLARYTGEYYDISVRARSHIRCAGLRWAALRCAALRCAALR